jgi:hypothetical protein
LLAIGLIWMDQSGVEFFEGSMSDWRKILVAYIKDRKAHDEGQPSDAIKQLTDTERDSLAAAVREAHGK